jgi:hypothetical protein
MQMRQAGNMGLVMQGVYGRDDLVFEIVVMSGTVRVRLQQPGGPLEIGTIASEVSMSVISGKILIYVGGDLVKEVPLPREKADARVNARDS